MKFRKSWSSIMADDGTLLGFEPTLDVSLLASDGQS